jgi:hypothetical protein
MRLHVLEAHTLCGGNASQRADLIRDEILDFARSRLELTSAESGEIRKSRMSSNGGPMLSRKRDCGPHGAGITSVKSARDIGGRDDRKKRRVLP